MYNVFMCVWRLLLSSGFYHAQYSVQDVIIIYCGNEQGMYLCTCMPMYYWQMFVEYHTLCAYYKF